MKQIKVSTSLLCTALALVVITLGSQVLASGTKTTTSTTTTKPADLLDSKDLAGQLLPEGKKIEIIGTLTKTENGRFQITSEETKRAYTILENSLLDSMVETDQKKPGQLFRTVARVTVFNNENYVFITKIELAS